MPHSMDATEVVVCSRVVSFAKELSLFDVIFEGDSRWVVQDINNKGVNLTLYGHVIKEIHYVCSILHRTSFQHVTRGGGGRVTSLPTPSRDKQFHLLILMFGWKNYLMIWMMYSNWI